jgi:hypothetical protein
MVFNSGVKGGSHARHRHLIKRRNYFRTWRLFLPDKTVKAGNVISGRE